MLLEHGAYDLDDDRGRVDVEALWAFLSAEAYWGRWRKRDHVQSQLSTAWRVVGGYERATNRMVGFARAVSDGVAFAYLADLYVVPDARGQGLGKELVRTMIERGPGADFRWSLHTFDAHGLYKQFGFGPADPTYLERPGRHPAVPGP